MKKFLAICLALVLGASMSFAQTAATKTKAPEKKEMVKCEKLKMNPKCDKAEGAKKCEVDGAEHKCDKAKAEHKCIGEAKMKAGEHKCEKGEGHKCDKGEGKKCEKDKKQCCKAECDMNSPHCEKCGTPDQKCGDCKDCAKPEIVGKMTKKEKH